MSDRKALQAGTSHFLGQNFARAFDIKFQNQAGELEFAWTTSWGTSTRMIGAVVMAHSDDDGLILPPRLAPVKAVILPISTDAEKLEREILPKAREIAAVLNKVLGPMAVQVDTDFHLRPGDRFFRHLQRGVPLRLELGEREMEAGKLRAVRRDTAEKVEIPWESAANEIPALLETIQKALFEKAAAFRDANTRHASSFEEMKSILENSGGFVTAYFGGDRSDEKAIKEATGATVRCFPLSDESTGTCFFTGKADAKLAIFARAY